VSFLGLLFLVLQAGAAPVAQSPAGGFQVQMGFRVAPDTVLVGQPFNLFIKVLAPRGVRFEFPAGPDTALQNGVRPIELRGEKIVSMLGDTAVALYHLVAWDIGTQPLRMPDVRVTFEGQERRPALGSAYVFVKSVLPADSSLRVPRPARPLIVLPVFNWLLWLAVVAAVIAAVLLWWIWRRYRNRPKPAIDPYVKAQQDFAKIESRRLVESDQAAEYFVAMVDVAREYLAARVPGVRRSDTTYELLNAMKPREGKEAELPRWLEEADLVKFARGDIDSAHALAGGKSMREIVDDVEARLNPESAPGKKLAAAKRERAA
jgi:hypothetical protein